jgi:squalene-hopene/tetraprenyl-beta-curcumene cyclase
MLLSRRQFVVAALAAVGCTRRARLAPTSTPFDESIKRASDFLVAAQSSDGAWRSDVYGTFKDGFALTPLALSALIAAENPETRKPIDQGEKFLAATVKVDGSLALPEYGLDYPVYTAAIAATIFSRTPHSSAAHAARAWLRFLRERQLTEALGWKPTDKEFGGWGYSRNVPHKPKPHQIDQPLIESNLSATVFALEALRAAGVSPKDEAFSKARVFVQRCQNWERDPEFDDGGFHFIYDDPVRNKAGMRGKSKDGLLQFYSYGSTTADGVRSLLVVGDPVESPRVSAAMSWLERKFRADVHPGTYNERHEGNRNAVYFYYAASVARACAALKMTHTFWATPLMTALMKLQRSDGSWVNSIELVRENDPIVATSFALMAMAACRQALPS